MLKDSVTSALAIFALFFSVTASAQDADLTREVMLEYRGTLDQDVSETYIRPLVGISSSGGPPLSNGLPDRNPNGDVLAPYPLAAGEEVVLTLTAQLPTAEFIAANNVTPNPDGTFRFFVSQTGAQVPEGSIGFSAVQVSEPFELSDAQLTGGVIVDYDLNSDSYVLADIGTGNGNSALVGGIEYPTYEYDAHTRRFLVCGGAGSPACGDGSRPTAFLETPGGSLSRLQIGGIGPFGIPTIGAPDDGDGLGFFDLSFTGAWNFFTGGSEGPGTPVPAPPMMILFGLAAIGILAGRRWGKAPPQR